MIPQEAALVRSRRNSGPRFSTLVTRQEKSYLWVTPVRERRLDYGYCITSEAVRKNPLSAGKRQKPKNVKNVSFHITVCGLSIGPADNSELFSGSTPFRSATGEHFLASDLKIQFFP